MPNSQEQNIKDILDIVSFIKDSAATKEDLDNFATKEDLDRFATKEDLDRFATKEDIAVLKEDIFFVKGDVAAIKEDIAVSKDEIMTHIDSFVGLHQKLDMELTALRSKYDRLESSMKKVLEHLHLNA